MWGGGTKREGWKGSAGREIEVWRGKKHLVCIIIFFFSGFVVGLIGQHVSAQQTQDKQPSSGSSVSPVGLYAVNTLPELQ